MTERKQGKAMRNLKRLLAAVLCILAYACASIAEDLSQPENISLTVLNAPDIQFAKGKKYAVYSGPGENYMRGANGKASVSTNDRIQVFGQENGWIMIQYAIEATHWRIGYISAKALPQNAQVPDLPLLYQKAWTVKDVSVTDDPLQSGKALTSLSAGEEVTILAALGDLVYIEGNTNPRFRGFVPPDSLSRSSDSPVPLAWVEEEPRQSSLEGMEQASLREIYDAVTMWLRETEGNVALLDPEGNQLDADKNMRMSSGTTLTTEADSLAAIDLDRERLAVLDQVSRADFVKNQGKIGIVLQDGAMYFSVLEPLGDEESFEIVMDDIILAIRGTCGLVQVAEAEKNVLLASGYAVMTRTTDEPAGAEEISVSPREMVTVAEQADGEISVSRRDVPEEEVPEFLVNALRNDPQQLDRVYEETGWDPERLFGSDVPGSGNADYMAAYQQVIAQAASYDYGLDNGSLSYINSGDHYQYALIYLDENDDIPALVMSSRQTYDGRYIRVFTYDPETRQANLLRQEFAIWSGNGGLFTGDNSRGLMKYRSDDTGTYVLEFYISNGTLTSRTRWTGSWDENPPFALRSIDFTDIQ